MTRPHVFQNRPHLISRWRILLDVQFKFGTLKLVLMRVIRSLVLGCGLRGMSGDLLEEGKGSERGGH